MLQLSLRPEPLRVPTAQELKVLTLAADDMSYKEIARSMGLSPHTVMRHAERVRQAFDTSTITGAVSAAFRAGYIT